MKTDRRRKSSDKVCDNVVEGKAPREKRTLNRSLGDISAFSPPPVGRRVGRGKMTAGFQNKIDAKKPDSRKNQAFLELLARFELAVTACGSLRFLSKRASRVRPPVRELPEKQKAPSF